MSYNDDDPFNTDVVEDDEGEEDDQIRSVWPRWLQPVILIVVLIVVVAMTAVPVLRALTLIDTPESDETRFERRARQNTAVIFAASVLERRSTSLAMRVTADELRDPVDAIIGGLQRRDSADLEDASASLVGISCAGFDDQPDDCFRASLAKPDLPPVEIIEFGVSIVEGRAIVVSVNRSGILART